MLSVALPSSSQCRSLTPEASVEVPGSAGTYMYQYCRKPCFLKLERPERSLETARGLINEQVFAQVCGHNVGFHTASCVQGVCTCVLSLYM